MDLHETIEFTRIVQALSKLYPRLPNMAATTAVNFFKDRLNVGRDVFNMPLKPRSKNVWVTRNRDKRAGRGIGIDTGTMIRDIQKIAVYETHAIIGTTRISAPYAKVFNEGFKGIVVQNVKPHKRRRWGTEKRGTGIFSVKTKKERTKKVKVIAGEVQVKAFSKRVQRNQPARTIMGNSKFLDNRVQATLTRAVIETVVAASTK